VDPRLHEEKAWLSALCSLPGMTRRRASELLTLHGSPQGAWEAVASGAAAGLEVSRRRGPRTLTEVHGGSVEAADTGTSTSWARLAAGVEPEARLRGFESRGIHAVVAGEPGYPALLAETARPPLVLYYRGRLPDPAAPALALVGSRKATPYGLEVAHWFASELAEAGAVVVSGAAYGVDAAAHRGALESGGFTAAVLGCGPDVAYPRANAALLESVASTGCVLSEYPPGTTPAKTRFPERNRIIAGISLGVVVVEAAVGSGALITAECALQEGREVMAVPGGILSPSSAGSNDLIRGGAALVRCPGDVVSELGTVEPRLFHVYGNHAGAAGPSLDGSAGPGSPGAAGTLGERERAVLEALDAGPADAEAVSYLAHVTAAQAVSSLSRLEVDGLVRRGPGGVYQAVRRGTTRGPAAKHQ